MQGLWIDNVYCYIKITHKITKTYSECTVFNSYSIWHVLMQNALECFLLNVCGYLTEHSRKLLTVHEVCHCENQVPVSPGEMNGLPGFSYSTILVFSASDQFEIRDSLLIITVWYEDQNFILQITKEEPSVVTPDESFAWRRKQFEDQTDTTDKLPTSAFAYKPAPQVNGPTPEPGPITNGVGHPHVSTSLLHLKDEPSRLPPSQSPYITLLQKNRGKLSLWELLSCFHLGDFKTNFNPYISVHISYLPHTYTLHLFSTILFLTVQKTEGHFFFSDLST